jgi:ZIP family zinc transporter
VPEGLCVGVAFGALAYGEECGGLAAACLLALGIGLQNFPEGAAISLPLRSDGFTRSRAFFWGHISGAVEPIAAVFGAAFVLTVRAALPFSLAFAAGAMIYVVAAELLPEGAERREATAIAAIVGFSVMMLMDTVFG